MQILAGSLKSQHIGDEAMLSAKPVASASLSDGDHGFLDSVIGHVNGFLYRCRADRDYTMIELSSGFERCCGHPVADLVGNKVRTYDSLIHPDDGGVVWAAVSQGAKNKTNWNLNYRLLHADGGYRWVHEDGGTVWNRNGEIVYYEGAVIDIHEQHSSMLGRTERLANIANSTGEVIESLRSLNLLTLYARIEAARAGEAGEGFSVVAEEMRRLASQAESLVRTIHEV